MCIGFGNQLLRWTLTVGIGIGAVVPILPASVMADESPAEPKSIRKTCGTCPEGYATVGVTDAPTICKDGDPTLVQCVPLGSNVLSVCGSCPEGYREMGGSSVPVRCGNRDGGRMSQCQLEKMGSELPDPMKGGKTCPPDCGSTAVPGQGALPPPPRYLPAPENK
ncbi:hypothetical protein [Nitrospira sp. KM1]|uniref:hypothetical protein n=1 Tax=Nitrospira sp. KM1 TaxID=1936990 RepID=UPI001564E5F7|nr:hypothetical protein [Nitrospira sp. KM1]